MDFTGERYMPDLHGEIELEHLHRYLQACEIAAGKIVLDIASGEGYGSAMLASKAKHVTGVDISIEAIEHARERYKRENLDFKVGNCADIPLEDKSVDLVVSFETIEHLAEHEKMMQEVKRVLRPDGLLLISSPDKQNYSVNPGYSNPYHVKELYEHEFKHLLENYFKNVVYFGQRVVFGSNLFSETSPAPVVSYLQENEGITTTTGVAKPLYLIALASDNLLPKIKSSVLEQPEIVRNWYATLAERNQTVVTLSGQLAELSAQLGQRGSQIQTLITQVNQQDAQIHSLMAHVETQVAQSKEQAAKIAVQATQIEVQAAQAQALRAEVQERDSQVQRLSAQMREIQRSGTWRLALLLSRIRVALLPPDSDRVRILKQLINVFRRTKPETNPVYEEELNLIRASELFDPGWYLEQNPDVAQLKNDPLHHYVHFGGFEGRDPSPNFSSAWYLEIYEDVKKAGMNPLIHYLKYGREQGRYAHPQDVVQPTPQEEELKPAYSPDEFDPEWYLSNNPDVAKVGVDPYEHFRQYGKFEGRLGILPKVEIQAGCVQFDPSKDTVLVVSHEASRTGAPILSLNIVQHLQKKYNVVSMLLGNGSIAENFREDSTFIVGPIPGHRNPGLASYAVEELLRSHKLKFAIVNSIVSYAAIPALSKHFVPTVSLIHEFSVYAKPKGVIVGAALWSNELIFSASVVHESAIHDYPILENHGFRILPQGRCTLPVGESDAVSLVRERAKVLKYLRPEGLPLETVIVLGIGTVQLRKGVDLFIECASKVMESSQGKNFRFIWIGNGYDPELDLIYSMYLADQIRRAGLQEHVIIIPETAGLEVAYQMADILLISSRLDPLPNVAIDAMSHGMPLVCFEKTTGIADILIANDLGEECVAPYLDTDKMASQVLAFANSKSFSQRVGEQLRQIATKEFEMENYVSQLEQAGLDSIDQMIQEQIDVSEINASGLARLDFFLTAHLDVSPKEAIRYYVRSWASGLERRKLFPGFHPGIFREQYRLQESTGDPLANYLRAGQPNGPWRYEVISSEDIAQKLPKDLSIALHLHVYYPDLLPEMLRRLNGNQVRPDLFISVPDESVREEVQAMLVEKYSGKIIEIQVVPNRGRDIGPLLTAFGADLADHYDVVGHLHTKKTKDFKEEMIGKEWYSFLLENLLGGQSNMADRILGRLAHDPSIGIIFPDDPHTEPYVAGWGRNRASAEMLGERFGLSQLPEYFLFPIGTMFWARAKALRPLFELHLDWQDYPAEPLPYDGTILHALERLLPFVAAKQGFRSLLTNVPGITR
jgi:glycosyltransferase involved in cell wall biosynthesis/ubiquinone/menaquinone biosynthesis C-methylase UbiE